MKVTTTERYEICSLCGGRGYAPPGQSNYRIRIAVQPATGADPMSRGIDPTIYGYAVDIAQVELFSRLDAEAIEPHALKLAEAFQRAFEEWAKDVEASVIPASPSQENRT